jgi:putative redox protein
MTTIDCETEKPGAFPHTVRVRTHTFRADVMPATGGEDSAPGPHDYFDSALATCKATTALWYAKKNGIPLERVETHIESDATEERQGKYVLKVRLTLHGPLSEEDKKRVYAAVAKCPIHKLMTTTDVVIETEPLA